jgi:hypothetical protein
MVDINRPFFIASPDSAALLTTMVQERKTPLYSQSGELVSNFDDAAEQTVDFVSLSFGYQVTKTETPKANTTSLKILCARKAKGWRG